MGEIEKDPDLLRLSGIGWNFREGGDVAQSGASKIDLMDEFAPGLGFRPRGNLGLSHEVVAASLGYKKGPRLRERGHLVSTFGRTS